MNRFQVKDCLAPPDRRDQLAQLDHKDLLESLALRDRPE